MPNPNVPSLPHLSLAALTSLVLACQSPAAPAPTPPVQAHAARAETPTPPVAASAEPSPAAPATAPSSSPTTDAPAAAELPARTTVLHVGDSFAESLGAPLGRRLQAAGVRNVLESKTPSYIPTWAGNGNIQRLLDKYKPDLVLITLGGNEFEIPTPADRAAPVKRLVQALKGRPCVWITPPRWKQDSGVLAVIRDNSAPCRYLDSDTIVHGLPLARDKVHPNEAGREQWAAAVLSWLQAERAPSEGQPWALKP